MNRPWAVVQMDATNVVEENLQTALGYLEEAAAAGCSLVAFPEFFLLRANHKTTRNQALSLDSEPVRRLAEAARKQDIHLLAGSIPVPTPDESGEVFNTSLYIDHNGTITGQYRKIHLFDVELEDFTVRESSLLRPGEKVVDVQADGVHCGLSICYDLRFPELYRQLADRRVEVVFVPSNFTRETGRAHWEPLIRARAIENQCYVVAPNQIGPNRDTGIQSLGQSMVVDPWGQVIARASDRESWFQFRIDLDYLRRVRRQLPSLDHIELL